MPQSLAKIYVHIIFATKGRSPYLSEGIRPELHAYMAKVLTECDSPPVIIGSVEDHVHILCALSKNFPVSKIVEEVKKSSSKWMKTKGKLLQKFHWQNGYGAFSVSPSKLEDVKSYIQSQEDHHRRISFQEEFRRFLEQYKVDYDAMCGIDGCRPVRAPIFQVVLEIPGRCPGLIYSVPFRAGR